MGRQTDKQKWTSYSSSLHCEQRTVKTKQVRPDTKPRFGENKNANLRPIHNTCKIMANSFRDGTMWSHLLWIKSSTMFAPSSWI